MRTPLTLPPCLLEGAKLLFPTLDFSRIYFYFEQNAVSPTTMSYLTRTEITFNGTASSWADPPESKETFKKLCHELVHALQKQLLWSRIIGFTASLTGRLLYGVSKSASQNCIEHEAWSYENKLEKWLKDNGIDSPCNFGAALPAIAYPQVGMQGKFAEAVKTDPSIIKTSSADCNPWDHIGPGAIRVIFGVILNVISPLVATPSAFSEGVFGYIGGAIGATVGLTVIAGLLSGIVSTVSLLIVGLIGLIIGSIVGTLVGNIIHWLGRLFGDDGGGINLMFSDNEGLTFNSKVAFERSAKPISLSFGLKGPSTSQASTRLAIAYTGTDKRVNLITLPSSSYTQPYGSKTAFELSEDCGPAVIHEGVRIRVGWLGTNNHLNTKVTYDGLTFQNPHTFNNWASPDNASPCLCVVGSTTIFAFIHTSLIIHLGIQNNAGGWDTISLFEHADPHTKVAITSTVANGFAIAWIGAEKRKRINILNLTLNPTTKEIIHGSKFTLVERSNAGPAIGFSRSGGEGQAPFMYLAWTGFDSQINFMRSRDFGKTWENKIAFEYSRPDCGPALTVHDDSGLICIGWTGTG